MTVTEEVFILDLNTNQFDWPYPQLPSGPFPPDLTGFGSLPFDTVEEY